MSESTALAIIQAASPSVEQLALTLGKPITSPDEYTFAAAVVQEAKSRIAGLEKDQAEIVDPISAGLAKIKALFRKPLDRLKAIEADRKQAQLAYREEAERKRLAEQARVQEAAQREQERLRREAETKAAAERARAAAEAEKAADLRREAEAQAALVASAAEADRIRAAAEAKAAALETRAEARTERAAEIQENVPTVTVPVVAQTAIPKVRGESVRTYWHARVVKPELVPREWWMIDEKKLEDFAGATKGTIAVPGVEFYAAKSLAAGQGRRA